ncbi:MAG: molybdopterin-dependent oxidoreductase [Kiloniellales bacterium]
MTKAQQRNGERRIPGYCALCRSRCGCISVVREGRLVAVEPDPGHPTGKKLCAKGRAAPEIVHDPGRLLYPMKRTRPKGDADPGWQRISWDEALDTTAAALKEIAARHGPEAVAFGVTTPSGTAMSDGIAWVERLIRAFGSPNTVYSTEICNWHKDHATAFTFGGGVQSPDFERAGCILLWGHNPSATWLSHAVEVLAARERGAKLIVVDPRRAGLANKADLWLRVRPGSDGALALGIAHVLLREELIDRDFLTRWSNGPLLVNPKSGRLISAADLAEGGDPDRLVAWDEAAGRPLFYDRRRGPYLESDTAALSGRFELETPDGPLACPTAFQLYADLLADYDPARVAGITGVPADQVVAAARLIGGQRPLAYYAWSGVGQQDNATQTDRSIALLSALTGSYGAPGGNVDFAKVPVNDVSGRELLPPAQRAKSLGLAQRPLGPGRDGWITGRDFCRAVEHGEPYAVEGLVCFGSNLLLSQPDTERTMATLSRLRFHVHADLRLNPTAAFADIVLPVCSAWEREGLRVGFGVSQAADSLVQLRAPVVEPLGESRSDVWIVFELAKRLGLANLFFGGDSDAGLRHILAPSGIALDELRARPEGVRVPLQTRFRRYAEEVENAPRGFPTPSRRVEIYSEQLLAVGQEPLPAFEEPAMSPARRPDLAARFPLVLTSAKVTAYCHSQYRGIPALRRKAPDPLLEISPPAAEVRGIADGDWLRIETPAGSLRARAKLNPQLQDDVVCGQHGWWEGAEALGKAASPVAGEGSANYNNAIGTGDDDPVSGSIPLRAYLCQVAKDPC